MHLHRPDGRHGTLKTLACAAALLIASPAAHAATLASGFLWSENAVQMVCLLWNVSASPVNVQSAQIVNSSGANVTSYESCTAQPLQPGKRCGIQAYNVTQAGGRATIDVPRNRLRGTCQLLAEGTIGIVSSDMR